MHEVMETVKPLAAEKPVLLEVKVPEPSVLVWADRDKVTQVLMNLVGNAIKFTPPQGRVTVSASRDGTEWAQVSVNDSGPGFRRRSVRRSFKILSGLGGRRTETQRNGPRPRYLQITGGVARRKDLG